MSLYNYTRLTLKTCRNESIFQHMRCLNQYNKYYEISPLRMQADNDLMDYLSDFGYILCLSDYDKSHRGRAINHTLVLDYEDFDLKHVTDLIKKLRYG